MSAAQLQTTSKAQLPTASTLQRQLNFPTSSTLLKTFNDHVADKFGPSLLNNQQPTLSFNASAAAPAAPAPSSAPAPALSSKAQLPTASTLQRQLNFPTSSTLLKTFDDHVAGKFGSSLLNAQQESNVSAGQPSNAQLPTSSTLQRQLNLPTASTLLKNFDQSGAQFGSNLNTQQPALSLNAASPANGAVPPPDCPCHLKKLLNQTPSTSASSSTPVDFTSQFSQGNFGNGQSFGNFDINSFNTNSQFPQSFGSFNFENQTSLGGLF